MVNLDYASHTQAAEEVLAEFCRVVRAFSGNPAARHAAGRAALAEIQRATEGIAGILGAYPSEIIYTSGASESNNLAIKGLTKAYKHVGKHILSTCLEHPSVSGTLSALQDQGYEVELVKIQPNGTIDLVHLADVVRPDTILLCVSAVDSELGVIQPIDEILKILENFPNCHLHVDAAQAVGKIPVRFHANLSALSASSCVNPPARISTMSISPHKFQGLCGFGILLKRDGIVIEPQIHGGKSTTIYRSGTPATAQISAAYTALKLTIDNLAEHMEYVKNLNQYLHARLASNPNIIINTAQTLSTPYIINISTPNIKAAEMQAKLDAAGIQISTKSACSTDNAPSRPVMAISRDKKRATTSWRVSLSHLTTMEEIDTLVAAVDKIIRECI